MSRLIHFSYKRPGKEADLYDHWLVVDEPDVKVMLLEGYHGQPVLIDGQTVAEAGAALLWFVFPGRRHDIGRFHLADDTFTGWYTNLCTPVEMEGDTWASTDLFLDHWISADGYEAWLDEHELADAIAAGLLDEAMQLQVREERAFIQSHLDVGAWPPHITIDMQLSDARGLLNI